VGELLYPDVADAGSLTTLLRQHLQDQSHLQVLDWPTHIDNGRRLGGRTPVLAAFSPNAVQLDALDDWYGWAGGLGPVGVVGSFDVPFGHLAFDESGVGAVSPGRVEAAT